MSKTPVWRLFLVSVLVLALAVEAFAQAKFVYSNNNAIGGNSVSGFMVAANGSLSPVPGSPFFSGGSTIVATFGTQNIAVCHSRSLLYTGNHQTSNVSGFRIDPGTGSLTPVTGSPFATGGNGEFGVQLACTPDERFLYAINTTSNDISAFAINPDGSLTLIPGSPFATGGSEPTAIKVTSGGRFLLVILGQSRAIGVYRIGLSGSLTPVSGSPFSVGTFGLPIGLETNCAASLVFATAPGVMSAAVDVFLMRPDGALVRIPGAPFTGRSIGDPVSALLSRDERFLFVSNSNAKEISVFAVGSSGALAEIAESPIAAAAVAFPTGLATDSEGTLLYVADIHPSISVFSIEANGTLSPTPGSPFDTGQPGFTVALAANPPRMCPVPSPDTGVFCVRDDSRGQVFRLDATTGEYEINTCSGLVLTGTGKATRKGCTVTLVHNAADRRINAKIDDCQKKATVTVQLFGPPGTFTITDRNTTDSGCACN